MRKRTYLAIDLKSFYASVECAQRHLNPLSTNLVVADPSRSEKTICLAVSPSLKAHGIPGRPRLFEVISRVREVNARRLSEAVRQGCIRPGDSFSSASFDDQALREDPALELSYITAPPRMALYLEYSTKIYSIYLKYLAPEDIHVYSVDEVFCDVTEYLHTYHMTAHELAMTMIREVLYTTGITATAGIADNLYLCKVAMDIVAKHSPADKDGVRIAELDELTYRKLLWNHRPLTDFWRVGSGYQRKLESVGLYTMGDIARCSLGGPSDFYNEDLLYKLFGVNAELLIDHAWGWEPCTIADIKAYRPASSSLSSGQVLPCAYSAEKGRLIVREMTDLLVLDLVDKRLVTDQMVLTIGYDIANMDRSYSGPLKTDHYGRLMPKHAHGTGNLGKYTSSTRLIMDTVMELYDQIIDPGLSIRRVVLTANHVTDERQAAESASFEQLNLFTDYQASETRQKEDSETEQKEKQLQQAMLSIQKRYGKNAILKGNNLQEGAMTIQRNRQIGGHKA